MESIQLNLNFRETETQSEDVSVKEKKKNWKMLLMKVKRLNCLFEKRKKTIFIIYLYFGESAVEGTNTMKFFIRQLFTPNGTRTQIRTGFCSL